MEARQTSAEAAIQAAPSAMGKAVQLLALIDAAGEAGISDPEIHRITKWPRSTICSVRNSVRVFLRPSGRKVKSEYGEPCTCWRRATVAEMVAHQEQG